MTLSSLQPFSLVGGTALSLRYGHRSSVDHDLFYHEKFDHAIIEKELSDVFGDEFVYEPAYKNYGIFCNIQRV